MSGLWGDVKFGWRMLAKHPGFAAVAVAALALGVGANTAIFSLINTLVLRPMPYREADRLVMLYERRPMQGRERNVVSGPDFADWRRRNRVFESVDGWLGWVFNMTSGEEPERITGALVSAGLFHTLGVQAALGRTFVPEEERTDPAVAVLSHGLWQRRFGGDAAVVGKTVQLNGRPIQIVGVMSASFHFYSPVYELFVPMDMLKFDSNRGSHFLNVVARVKPGVTLDQARGDMVRVMAELEQEYPRTNRGHTVNVFPFREELIPEEAKHALPVMLGAVGFVLLIACANVANLLLARAAARQREVAVRLALGASRWQLVRQMLIESVLLALAAGALGVLLAQWGVDLLVRALPMELALLREIPIDGRVLGFTLALSVVTGVLFGLFPALRAVAGGGSWVAGAGRVTRKLAHTQGVLVVAEVALSLVLLAGAGLLLRSFLRIMDQQPGFQRERLLTFAVGTTRAKYPGPEQVAGFYREFLGRVRSLPGVQGVAAVRLLPLSGQGSTTNFGIEGRAPSTTFIEQYNARPQCATPDYFRTMGVPLLKGRYFTDADNRESQLVTIINQTLARKYLPDEEPLGKRIFAWGDRPREIIGLVGDVKHDNLTGAAYPEIYFPYAQEPSAATNVVVRTTGDPTALVGAIKAELKALDPEIPVAAVRTMEELASATAARPRLLAALLAVFAAIAAALAAVGIFGVMSYAVEQRTQEIGIRMALGAERRDVSRLIVRQGMILASIGVAIGLAGGFAARNLLEKLLFGVKPGDPLTYAGVAAGLLVVAFAANYLPARRATKVDPAVALRYE